MSDFFNSVFETWSQRIRSPILGSVILALVALNWRPLFYLLFAEQPVANRIAFFDANTDWGSLLVFPVLLGVSAAALSPWVKVVGAFLARRPLALLSEMQEQQASEKRVRGYRQEAQELDAKTDRDVAIIESQSRVREAEENQSIQDEKRLKSAETVDRDLSQNLQSQRDQRLLNTSENMSEISKTMLVQAARSQSGTITHHKYLGGESFHAGNEEMKHDGSRKTVARLESAIEELERLGLIRATGTSGSLYELTKLGYEVADVLA